MSKLIRQGGTFPSPLARQSRARLPPPRASRAVVFSTDSLGHRERFPNKLILCVLAAATCVAGCNKKVNTSGQAQFEVSWRLTGVTCEEVGVATVRLVTTSVDGKITRNTGGRCEMTCQGIAGTLTSQPLDLDDYDTHLDLLSADGMVVTKSPTVRATLDAPGGKITLLPVTFPFDPRPEPVGRFRVSWTIGGATCESLGAEAISVVTTSAIGEVHNTYNDCTGTSGAAESDPLPLGEYRVLVRLVKINDPTDAGDDAAFAESLPAERNLVTAGESMQIPAVRFSFDELTNAFWVNWSLISATCESLGANAIVVAATGADGSTVVGSNACHGNHGTAILRDLAPSDYYVVVRVVAANGPGIADDTVFAESSPTTVSIPEPGGTVILDPVSFDFTPPTHAVTFTVDFGEPEGENCEKVVQQEIVVTGTGDDMCVSFGLSGFDDRGAPFASDTCGTATRCLETTVVQTIADVPSGDYDIQVVGLVGVTGGLSLTCYQGALSFTVAGAELDLGALAVPFDPLPAAAAACNAMKPSAWR